MRNIYFWTLAKEVDERKPSRSWVLDTLAWNYVRFLLMAACQPLVQSKAVCQTVAWWCVPGGEPCHGALVAVTTGSNVGVPQHARIWRRRLGRT